ncbi:hypothetical protein [Streptomyces clavuligerus]|nr:hypothetical protein [Streptomyces clavuligerus]MBY6306918.1 hypothetical protein [Streptomyces clavuligerus]QPL66985.1 hypothetical protein I3J04_28875 [Streptomyces clavuligerus]QPL73015.1 hypothetical protein I3J05_28925 [Streptomyces clavuligerus]QPL79088.1 hypothetical protein I3J06_28840 [Streptomyces clavuligerus]QPL85119.1 hypothetical protein I3J07_28910 [Streptomyces clavuligerus]
MDDKKTSLEPDEIEVIPPVSTPDFVIADNDPSDPPIAIADPDPFDPVI